MYGVNLVILAGRVGDVKIKDFDGDKVANISLATSYRPYKTKSGKEVPERTEWHNLVMRGGLAKVAESSITKGRLIHVTGSLKTRKYNNNGTDKYVTEIVVDDMQFLDNKKSSDKEDSPSTDSNSTNKENIPTDEELSKMDLSNEASSDLPF